MKVLFDVTNQSFHFSEEDQLELASIYVSNLPEMFAHCGQLAA